MARNKIRFTKQKLESIEPPPKGKRAYYYDDKEPYLRLQVTGTGRKTFQVYKWQRDTAITVTLGTFPEMTIDQARKKAQKILADLAEGKNPNEEKRKKKQEMTFGELFEVFLKRHVTIKPKTVRDYKGAYDRYLARSFAKRKLSSITRSSIASIHARIGKQNPVQANRVLALISTVMGRAIEWGLIDPPNPCQGIKKFKEKPRDRFLKAEELPKFFKALEQEPNDTVRDFLLIALLTGARRSNVLEMRWQDIDWDSGIWHIPETKNNEAQNVTLSQEALEILKGRYERNKASDNPSVYVFPGKGRTGHLVEPKRAWKRILDRARLKDLRIHDLRRTLGSWQAITGASLPIIGKSLCHKTPQTTAIYAKLDLDPVRQSVQKAVSTMFALAKQGRKEEKVVLLNKDHS